MAGEYGYGWNGNEEPPKEYAQKEFYELPQLRKYVSSVKNAAIICFICAGVTLLASVFTAFGSGSFFGFIDVVLLVVIGILILRTRSFVASVILLMYGIYNLVIMFLQTGKPGGILIIIAGIYAVISTRKLEKMWKDYCATGNIPE